MRPTKSYATEQLIQITLRMGVIILAGALPLLSQMTFGKVEVRTQFGSTAGNEGLLIVEADRLRFVDKKGAEYFSIPTKAVNEIAYLQTSGNWSAGWTQERKHFMTVRFKGGADQVEAVEFKLHKSNYRAIVQRTESVTGLAAIMIHEDGGIKHSKQTVTSRNAEGTNEIVVDISSIPTGVEIEIDGTFSGITPQALSLAPGEHKFRLHKNGLKDWKRKIELEKGDKLAVVAELEEKTPWWCCFVD